MTKPLLLGSILALALLGNGAFADANFAAAPAGAASALIPAPTAPLPHVRARAIIATGTVQSLVTDSHGGVQSVVLQASALGSRPAGVLTLSVAPDRKFYIGWAPAAPGDLVVGAQVAALLQGPPQDGAAAALWVSIVPPSGTYQPGTVQSVAVDANGSLQSFVLVVPATPKGPPAATLTVSVTPVTTYRLDNRPATATGLAAGDRGTVQLQSSPVAGAGTALLVDVWSPLPTN